MKKLIVLLSVILYCLLPINDQTTIHTLNCKLVDPDYYTTVGDGNVSGGSNANWNTVHNATNGYLAEYTPITTRARVLYNTSANYNIHRAFLPFDTSAIPGGATVTATTVNLYGADKNNSEGDAYSYIVVVSANQASTTELITEDYDQAGSVAWSDTITIDAYSLTGWNVLTLNATGRAGVTKGGITKLGLREGHDMENVAPDVQDNSGTYATFNTNESDYTPDRDLYLSVTYETADDTGNTMMHSIWLVFLLGIVFLRRKCES